MSDFSSVVRRRPFASFYIPQGPRLCTRIKDRYKKKQLVKIEHTTKIKTHFFVSEASTVTNGFHRFSNCCLVVCYGSCDPEIRVVTRQFPSLIVFFFLVITVPYTSQANFSRDPGS